MREKITASPTITAITDNIPYPETMSNIMVQKCLQYISQNTMIGNDTYNVSGQELLTLLNIV